MAYNVLDIARLAKELREQLVLEQADLRATLEYKTIQSQQALWDFLNHQQLNWKRAHKLAQLQCDLALDERRYTEAYNRGAEAEQEIEAYEGELRKLEDWLIDHNAPGWVST